MAGRRSYGRVTVSEGSMAESGILQHLVLLHARRQAPVFAPVIGAQFAQQLALGAGETFLEKSFG
jgi:hypothetical protein